MKSGTPNRLDLVIARGRDDGDEGDGGIGLQEWKAFVASDPSLGSAPYWEGLDPRTRARRKLPIPGGARLCGAPGRGSQLIWWHRGRLFAEDCDEAVSFKVQALASELNASCFPLKEAPALEFRPGDRQLELDGVALDLGFPISSAIWWRKEHRLVAIEDCQPARLHVLRRDGTTVQELLPPADYDFYYLTPYFVFGISVVCCSSTYPTFDCEDWNFAIDLQNTRLEPLSPTR